LPLVGTLIALAFMKFYPLDKEAMEKVQIKIAEMKQVGSDDDAGQMPEAMPEVALH